MEFLVDISFFLCNQLFLKSHKGDHSLKTEPCHDAKFVVTGGTVGCGYDNCRATSKTALALWKLSAFGAFIVMLLSYITMTS